MGNLFAKPKRRHIYRVAAAYAVVAWVLMQLVNTITPTLNLPNSAETIVLVLLAVGFPVAIFFAWINQLSPVDGTIARPQASMLDRVLIGSLRAVLVLRYAWWPVAVRPARIPADLEVLVVSPGGVGTTFLMKHIRRFCRTNCPYDSDDLKHRPVPPRALRRRTDIRIIYIYGDEEEIFKSIKRRGWTDVQGAKLGSIFSIFAAGKMAEKSFIRAVRRQRRHWTNRNDIRVFLLNYDDIWKRIDDLGHFIGIESDEFRDTFPERRVRQSNLTS